MKELPDTNRKRSLRRLRTRIFMRRNGVYLGAMLALLVAAGITAGVLGMKETGTGSPAEKSYDERLKDAAVSTPAPSPAQPANTHKPLPTPEPTAEPTLMPDLTPAPSATAAPLPKDQPAPPVDGICDGLPYLVENASPVDDPSRRGSRRAEGNGGQDRNARHGEEGV